MIITKSIDPKFYLVEKPIIGASYHLSWARKKGMVWKLVSIDGDNVTLRTPKTKKILISKIYDLRETNKTAIKKAKKKLP